MLYHQQQQYPPDPATEPTSTAVLSGGGGGGSARAKAMARPGLFDAALSSDKVVLGAALPRMDLATSTAHARMTMKRTWEASPIGDGTVTMYKKQCTTIYPQQVASTPTNPLYYNYWGNQSRQLGQPQQQVPVKPQQEQQQQVDACNPKSVYQLLGVDTTAGSGEDIVKAAVDIVQDDANAADVGWVDGLFNLLDENAAGKDGGDGGESSIGSDEENLPQPCPPPQEQQFKQPVSHAFVNEIVDDALSEISESDWNLLLDDNPTSDSDSATPPASITTIVPQADTQYPQHVQIQPRSILQTPAASTAPKVAVTKSAMGAKKPVKPLASSTRSYLEEMRRNYYKCTHQLAPQETNEGPIQSLPAPANTSRPGAVSPVDCAVGVRQPSPTTTATATPSSTRPTLSIARTVTPQTAKAVVSNYNIAAYQQRGAFDMNIKELKSSQRPV